MKRVCVIGLGFMGSALAKRLKSLGFEVTVYNRTIEKAIQLAKDIGADYVDAPYRCVERCEAIAIFVADDRALLDVLTPPNGVASRSCSNVYVVNMSTVTTGASLTAKKLVEACGGRYVELPVFGSVPEVLNGKLVAMFGGARDDYEKLKSFAEAIASKYIYVGEVPKAMALKLAINQLGHVIAASLGESLAFLKAFDIDFSTFVESVKGTWLESIVLRFLDRVLEQKTVRFKLELAAKDLAHFVESAREVGVAVHIAAVASQRYEEAAMHGYGERDYPQIGRYMIDYVKRGKEQKQ
jgi:3-hydroxyisobutyrate dehydrogenase